MKQDTDNAEVDVSPFFDYGIDLKTKTLYIGDDEEPEKDDRGITAKVTALVIKGLHILDNIDSPDPITILFSTEGGEEMQGLAIYDAIRCCAHDTIIKVYGPCMSSGVWVLQAGTKRLLSPNARLMIHSGAWGFGEEHPQVVKSWVKQYERDEEVSETILLERIWEKRPDFTREELRDLLRFDTIFMPQEAIDLGLADGIIQAKSWSDRQR